MWVHSHIEGKTNKEKIEIYFCGLRAPTGIRELVNDFCIQTTRGKLKLFEIYSNNIESTFNSKYTHCTYAFSIAAYCIQHSVRVHEIKMLMLLLHGKHREKSDLCAVGQSTFSNNVLVSISGFRILLFCCPRRLIFRKVGLTLMCWLLLLIFKISRDLYVFYS